MTEWIERLECPRCGSSNKKACGVYWRCRDCNRTWNKRIKKNPRGRVKGCTTWNKGFTKETSSPIATGTDKMTKTKRRQVKEGKLNPIDHLPSEYTTPKIKTSPKEMKKLYETRSQKELSEMFGVSQGTISHFFTKHNIPARPKYIFGSPNGQEKWLIERFGKLNIPLEYIGDGSFWIENRNPDFINQEKKKVVEYFGKAWHEPEDEEDRMSHYEENGWDCFVIWERDITSSRRWKKTAKRLLNWFFSE